MEHTTQITLTDRDRALLNKLMAVATSFLANVYAKVPWDDEDFKIIHSLNGAHDEIAALAIKMNKDLLE